MNNEELLLYLLSNSFISLGHSSVKVILCKYLRESHIRLDPENIWLDVYHEVSFSQLFRMQKTTFHSLCNEIIANDDHALVKKISRRSVSY